MTVQQITKRNDVRVVTMCKTVTVATGLRPGTMVYVGPLPPDDKSLVWVDTSGISTTVTV